MAALESNMTTFKEKIYGASSMDISKKFLPDNEIVKNILKSKNPAMTKAEANQMVDGKKPAGVKELPKVYKAPKGGMSIAGKTYLPEANKIKSEVRQAVAMLVKEQKALIQDLIKTAIQTGTAISGAAIMMAPISFNVPGAINLILVIINGIMAIISKILAILQWLEPLKFLRLLIDPKKFDAATAPINTALIVLIGIFTPISALKQFIDILMGQMKSKTSNSKSKKQINKKIVKDDVEINAEKAKKEPDWDKIEELNEDMEAQKMMLKGFDINIPVTKNGEFDESELKISNPDIFDSMQAIKNIADKIASGEEITVYDVQMPSGQTLININEEALDKIRETYKVIFDVQNSNTQNS